MADSLTTKRSQRVREAICRKSAQTFHLPLVKYEDEYKILFPNFGHLEFILNNPALQSLYTMK